MVLISYEYSAMLIIRAGPWLTCLPDVLVVVVVVVKPGGLRKLLALDEGLARGVFISTTQLGGGRDSVRDILPQGCKVENGESSWNLSVN